MKELTFAKLFLYRKLRQKLHSKDGLTSPEANLWYDLAGDTDLKSVLKQTGGI